GAVVDLLSGDLVEVSTYYPNGARENLWTNDALVPLEPMGFTTKEADAEIGVTYFGERWLIPRLGRWATPDPLHIHASGGGETGNSYHYVSGNLLQAVDPLGLCAEGLTVDECERFEGAALMMYQVPLDEYRVWSQLGPGLFGGLPNTVSTGVPSPLGMALRNFLFTLKNDRIAHVLIDRYLQRQAGTLRLTGDDFAHIADPSGLDPRTPNGDRPNALVTEVGRLQAAGGGTSHVRWGTSALAFVGGTLGQYGVVWEGDLVVAEDGTYSFTGTAHAEDFYDFDPRPLFGPNARASGWFGELQTDLMYAANIGVGFEVRTDDVAVSFTQDDALVPIRAPGDGISRTEEPSAAGRAEGVDGVVDGVAGLTADGVGGAVSEGPAADASGR
ncbi:MAG: RHS repeat-associated core domain-containing protein, partial [Deltaproteobacteria bacterium]